MNRRHALKTLATSAVPVAVPALVTAQTAPFTLQYVLSSAMYGDMKLAEILPEVAKTGAIGLDLWGKPHGTQREEVEAMGIETAAKLFDKAGVKVAVSTRYPLGCFGLQPEMPVLKRFGGKVLVCGSSGPKDPKPAEVQTLMKDFLEKMKPHADAAANHGLVIAIENHSSQLLSSPESIRSFAELNRHPALGVAFAPHHLHANIDQIPSLIRALGKKNLPFFYFQEHGIGSQQKVAKEIELQQLPGRGPLDYTPIVGALKEIEFNGFVEIFMHPTPRGVPILPTATEITDVINESRDSIEKCLSRV
ncbi:MAG: Sugar phosphate isomerase/epimerase [Verrucomicrobia bacterium]|nr:MAG: Sugar phosphate isomerase/epimerase [Verrucomicrobiota bacterium]